MIISSGSIRDHTKLDLACSPIGELTSERTIILSDCHGRPDLITNVLDHAKDWDRAVFLGDILDIGNHPLECIDILLENDINLIWGNHDLAPIINKHIHPVSNYDTEVYNRIRDGYVY
jgi:calcineurin-like phosphoesterase family protein